MKKIAAFSVAVLTLLLIVLMAFSMYGKMRKADEVLTRINYYPEELIEAETKFSALSLGEKRLPIILTYFKTTCPYCQSKIISIQSHDNLKNHAKIILISEEDKETLDTFIEKFPVDTTVFRVLRDKNSTVKALFDVKGVPATFVYNAEGELISSHKGEVSADYLMQILTGRVLIQP